MSVIIYGIKNCDTIKKAKTWLQSNGVEFSFHDYRQDGLTDALLNTLESTLGWEAMLNKRGTTWRKLPDEVKEAIDKASAIQIMRDNPAIIKRPIIQTGSTYTLGFSSDTYQSLFL